MQAFPIKSPRKLIEVALPLDVISAGCQQEKNPFLKGHPRSIHLWWARRPLAAARAVLFAQLVNDPGYQQGHGFKYGVGKKKAALERKRLFRVIEELVQWENTTNEVVLSSAREEIRRSWREVCELNRDHPDARELFNAADLPAFHDPFAGGGTIPLEAQRLGLRTFASDLNPVAVLINKAMIEIPPRFAHRAPVNPETRTKFGGASGSWKGAKGLAADIRYYGTWLRSEAVNRIGQMYPPAKIDATLANERKDLKPLIGQSLEVVAWLWARTVRSPNPAFSHVEVPLAASFVLSNKPGKEAYVEAVVEKGEYRFSVRLGKPPVEAKNGTKLARGANFRCLLSGTAIESEYIKAEGRAGRMGTRLMAIVAAGPRGKVYLPPTVTAEKAARVRSPAWKPSTPLPDDHRNFWTYAYGLTTFGDLFTPRQLVALTTLSGLIQEAQERIRSDAIEAGYSTTDEGVAASGDGAKAYAEAIALYLASGLSQLTRYSCATCAWNKSNENVAQAFGRQAIPMAWDFAEAHPLLGSLSIEVTTGWVSAAIEDEPSNVPGSALQADAQEQTISRSKIISTDPPYYDNIAYADLSDFFYVWLRQTLRPIFPDLLATISVPKAQELVATPYRHGGAEQAEIFFLNGMTAAMRSLKELSHPGIPVTIYYAFKQSETNEGATSSTGWETFLTAVLEAGFHISGTWPMRTEKTEGLKGTVNALASSIILVCRKRDADAPQVSRREFLRELNAVLPDALDEMTRGSGDDRSPVAPVDLSQAIIGPGMAVFSKYSAVLEADGSAMSVRTALQLINRFLAEDDFDADTQFCLHWFEQQGWTEGAFGGADVLARGKGTSVDGIKEAGVIQSGRGRVRLLKWSEYPTDWDPRADTRTPVWEALHQLIRAYRQGGDSASGTLLAALGGKVEAVRQLAYRLYTLCERLGQAEDARAYNELITGWSGIESAAGAVTGDRDLFGDSI